MLVGKLWLSRKRWTGSRSCFTFVFTGQTKGRYMEQSDVVNQRSSMYLKNVPKTRFLILVLLEHEF